MGRPRQQRAVQTRAAILHSAGEVFAENGYAGASISAILEGAHATAGAMYFHFSSKEDLAREVMHYQPERIVPFVESSGLQRLVDITMVWAHQLQEDLMLQAGVRLVTEQSFMREPEAAAVYGSWTDIMEECLHIAHDKGELQAGVDPRELAEFVVSSCTGMQIHSVAVSGREDLMDRAVRLWRMLLPGIAVPAVVARIEMGAHRVPHTPA